MSSSHFLSLRLRFPSAIFAFGAPSIFRFAFLIIASVYHGKAEAAPIKPPVPKSASSSLYGDRVSPDLTGRGTDAGFEDVREWENRPLHQVYPVVFFDALRVKIRDDSLVRNNAVDAAHKRPGQSRPDATEND